MINRANMFEPIVEAHPEFSTIYQDFLGEWGGESEGLPHYLLIPELIKECSRLKSEGHIDRVKKILAVVELWLSDGDEYVKTAATVGFLEDFQKQAFHPTSSPEDFIPLLGPESRYWWYKVERFWKHGEIIADDR